MSAVVRLPSPKAPPSIEALTNERGEVDAEIVEALARLATGEATDDEVAALRARRAKIEDRIAGARTLSEREAKRRADDEREADERALKEALAAIERVREHMDRIAAKAAERFVAAFADAVEVRQLVTEGAAAERVAKGLATKLGSRSTASAPNEGLFVGTAHAAIEQARRSRDRSLGDLTEDLLSMRVRP